jgi:hypothetical protein
MEVSGDLHDLAALPQGKAPSIYPFDRLGWSQNRCGRRGEGKSVALAESKFIGILKAVSEPGYFVAS